MSVLIVNQCGGKGKDFICFFLRCRFIPCATFSDYGTRHFSCKLSRMRYKLPENLAHVTFNEVNMTNMSRFFI